MKHKKLFIAALLCVVLGVGLCAVAYRARGDMLFRYTDLYIGDQTNPYAGSHEMFEVKGVFSKYRIEADMAEIEIVKGDKFTIETWNLPSIKEKDEKVQWSEKTENGTYINTLKVDSPIAQRHFDARIKVTLPETVSVLEIDDHLGSVDLNGLSLAECRIEADLGDVDIENCQLSVSSFDLAMGSFEFEGLVKKSMNIDCAMGDAALVLNGKPQDYTVEADSDVGDVDIAGAKTHRYEGNARITIDLNMGDIDVAFEA